MRRRKRCPAQDLDDCVSIGWDWTPRLGQSILGRMSTETLSHSLPNKTSENPEIAYWTAGQSGPKVMLVMG